MQGETDIWTIVQEHVTQVFMLSIYLFSETISSFISPSKNNVKHLRDTKNKCNQCIFTPGYVAVNEYKMIAVPFKKTQLSQRKEQIF